MATSESPSLEEAGVGYRGGPAGGSSYNSLEETPLLRGKNDRGGRYGSLDDALDSVGVGAFHIVLVLVCGWAIASDSVEIQCISFVTPQLDSSSSQNQVGRGSVYKQTHAYTRTHRHTQISIH